MAASRFAEVTDKEISEIKINSVPKNLCKNTKIRLGEYSPDNHLAFGGNC